MIMFVLFAFLILFIIFGLVGVVGGVVQYIRRPKPSRMATMADYRQYYHNKEWQHDNEPENEPEPDNDDIQLQERILILDETIVKYNQLLDNLRAQYNFTSDDKKRSVILSKQIATMEKLNRALEKREKLG